MKQLEEKYRHLLESVRNDKSLLKEYSYESAKDDTGNQAARTRMYVSLLNFKKSSDYDIASYLFDEEIKAKHDFTQIEDYSTDILELSALVLTSFEKVEDILRMAVDRPNEDEEYVFVEPELYLMYGYEACHDFLNSSVDSRAASALMNFNELFESVSEESIDVEVSVIKDTHSGPDGNHGIFYFPFQKDDLIYFCIILNEVEMLEAESDRWFDSVKIWDHEALRVCESISRMINKPSFDKKFVSVKKELSNQRDQISQEKEIDADVSENTNILGVFFFVLLLIGTLFVSLVFAFIGETQSTAISEKIGYWVVSLIAAFCATFATQGLRMTNTNDLEHFKKVYLSGERTPSLSWQYTCNRWSDFANKKFEKIKKIQRITLTSVLAIAVGLCVFMYDPVLVSIIVWLACISSILFFVNVRKDYIKKRQAYLHTTPASVDFYNRGMVIGGKHYIPFNTRYVWLLNIEFMEEDSVPYLEFETNVRGGKYPDANIVYHRVPVPSGKENEAKRYAASR